ncbi:hypothetical protein ACRAWF_03095 [Streptomyces sp. L7]
MTPDRKGKKAGRAGEPCGTTRASPTPWPGDQVRRPPPRRPAPPQREFARRHGIANSTATRVYRELARRGLTVGEVGRGTFVRATSADPAGAAPALTEPADGRRVDLELNYPVVPEQNALLAEALGGLLRPDALGDALRPVGTSGFPAARESAADHARPRRLAPGPGADPLRGQRTAGDLGRRHRAAVPPGARLGVEELTYPVVKAVAARLGVTLVPLAMDDAGLVPEAVEEAHTAAPLHAVLRPAEAAQPALAHHARRPRRAAGRGIARARDPRDRGHHLGLPLATELPPLAAYAPN